MNWNEIREWRVGCEERRRSPMMAKRKEKRSREGGEAAESDMIEETKKDG